MTKLLAWLLFTAICIVAMPAFAVDRSHPDSPDFDPIARMKRFDPNWEPPKVSAQEVAKSPLGSWENPIRTHGPTGQKRYLSRLTCPDMTPPDYKRLGSQGDGVYGFHVDEFEVVCGERRSVIFMDLYHPNYVELAAVPGFGLQPGRV